MRTNDGTADLAAAAVADLAWLGPPAESARFVSDDEVADVQESVADGRVLRDPYEHWAESVIIAMASQADVRGSTVRMMMLTEDYSARIRANDALCCTPLSVHRLLWELVQAGHVPAERAEHLAVLLKQAGRGADYTAEDFADRTRRGLARVGRP